MCYEEDEMREHELIFSWWRRLLSTLNGKILKRQIKRIDELGFGHVSSPIGLDFSAFFPSHWALFEVFSHLLGWAFFFSLLLLINQA